MQAKVIVIRLVRNFSRAYQWLYVRALSSDWFIINAIFKAAMIGPCGDLKTALTMQERLTSFQSQS